MSNTENPNLAVVTDEPKRPNILVRGARRAKSGIESHPKISLVVGVAAGFVAGAASGVFGTSAVADDDENEVEETDADVA